MRQIFNRKNHHLFRACFFAFPLLAIALGTLITFFKWTTWASEVDVPQFQNIPFSHQHHVGEIGIDCRYCHSTVSDSSFAGMPSTQLCLTCHSQIWKNAPMLKPLHESLATNTPLEWNRVNRVPRFSYFDHGIHIQKGVGCSSCHGPVDQMPLFRKAHSMTMRECVSCHEAPEKYVRPKSEVYDMNWRPPPDDEQRQLGPRLVREYHIHKSDLTDCKTCHR